MLFEVDSQAVDRSILSEHEFRNQKPSGVPVAAATVSGAGRGCNTLTGRFSVLKAKYDASGNVKSFAADFEQHCEGASPALAGSIRYKSKLQQISVSNAAPPQSAQRQVAALQSTLLFGSSSGIPPFGGGTRLETRRSPRPLGDAGKVGASYHRLVRRSYYSSIDG